MTSRTKPAKTLVRQTEAGPRPATPGELKEVAAALQRRGARRPRVPYESHVNDSGGIQTSATIDDEVAATVRLQEACGTNSGDWSALLLGQLLNAGNEGSVAGGPRAVMAGLAFLNGLQPANEIEAALGAQMFAMHMMAMSMARRAEKLDMVDHIRQCADLANKAARTFSAQVEALAKLRGGGKQQVEVVHVHKHVYVAPGGQAIVGDVHQGGGGAAGSGEQPLELFALAHAPGVSMPGPHEARDILPIAGAEGAETVPTSRRGVTRGSHGTGERSLSERPLDEEGQGGEAGTAGHDHQRESVPR